MILPWRFWHTLVSLINLLNTVVGMIVELIALILFGVLGYQDWKTHKVNNALIFLLWIPACILSPIYLLSAFIALGLCNEVIARFFGPMVGWGDVLMFGPFIAILTALGLPYAIGGYYVFALCLIATYVWKKKIPLGAVFFLTYSFCLLVSCIL